MQRLRCRYAKRGRLRFASHRDIARTLERALRRAGVPMAFSAGFTPHPKISYAGAAPTGVASEAEYFELALASRRDPDRVRAVLDASLPADIHLLEVVEAGPGGLADRLQGSEWEIRLPGVAEDTTREAVDRFLVAETIEVERLTKKGLRRFDVRAAVVRMAVSGCADEGPGVRCAILRMVVRHATPAVRPDDVLTGLRLVAGLAPPSPPLVTRLAQGPLDATTGRLADPFAPDRRTAVSAEPGERDGEPFAEPVDVVGAQPRGGSG
ncbi:MAG: DUF2344 domain-containing protein [Streptosporangiales bacterium]|nr:DUF2344 domain-containing protein [Streptosporangiales bacterium]